MASNNKKKKIRNIIIISVSTLILVPVLLVGGYVTYVAASYKRIGNTPLSIENNISNKVSKNKELTVTSYNIGFGAYSPDYTFFLDKGHDKDGNRTVGKSGKGKSYDDVMKNTLGSIEESKKLNSDFYLLQEVDTKSDRSYHINQKQMFLDSFKDYGSTYAINFDSAYLMYPLFDHHGKSKAGLQTFSKYDISEANRVEYTIAGGISKFFDLDRCFSTHRIKVEDNKELILINSHMSAYDEGGVIRNKQINELNEYMLSEYNKGNYVICGGDFNHDLLINNPLFSYDLNNKPYENMYDQFKADWVNYMFDENKKCNFASEFKVIASDNEPSCRGCDVTWIRGSTFVTTVDGFIVSDNVKVNNIVTTKVGENGFGYSDHQPTTLSFELI